MTFGVMSNVFGASDPDALAAAVANAGLDVIQLHLPSGGLAEDAWDPVTARRLRDALAARGKRVAALSGYVNVLDPDPARRKANLARVETALRRCRDAGTDLVVTEAGTLHPTEPWGDHPRNHTPEGLDELAGVAAGLARTAEAEGVTVCFEPYVLSPLDTPARVARFFEIVPSRALGVLLDVAGLMTPARLSDPGGLAREAFALFGDRIRLAHGLDVRFGPDGAAEYCAAGQGAMEFAAVGAAWAAAGFTGPVVLEYLDEPSLPAVLARLRGRLEAGAARR